MQVHEVRLVRLPHPSPAAVIAWPPHPASLSNGICRRWALRTFRSRWVNPFRGGQYFLIVVRLYDDWFSSFHFISFLRNPLTPFTRSNFQATSPAVLRGQEGEGNQESSNNAGTAVVQASSSFDYCAIMWKMLEGREHISTHFGGYFVGMWLDQVFNSCNILVNIFVLMVSSIWNSFHLCCIQKLRDRHH